MFLTDLMWLFSAPILAFFAAVGLWLGSLKIPYHIFLLKR
jgi:hypothetical protein